MESIRVLIVEDQLLIAESLAAILVRNGLQVVATCTSGEEAIALSQEHEPDLILMDIQLNGAIDGISAAHTILREQDVVLIYLSDYEDSKTVDRAKKTFPANYLSKPFQEGALLRAIDIAFTNANSKASSRQSSEKRAAIYVRTNNQAYVKVLYDELLYLEASRSYCNLVTASKVHMLSNSLNHVLEQLDHADFMRTHRSYVVNVSKIDSLEGNIAHIGDREIPISKDFREPLLKRLKLVK